MDAGRGLLLIGDGKGGFKTVPGQQSGIEVYGDQRGAAVADFNGDRRTDLAVSQNEDTTKLYLNKTEKQGISIHLIGPASNRDAIGSGIRLVYEDGTKGPRREIRAGEGYRSQSSRTQVMGYSQKVQAIEVNWFDGTTDTVRTEEGRVLTMDRYGPCDFLDALNECRCLAVSTQLSAKGPS